MLDPRKTYNDDSEWDKKATELAGLFIKNFDRFTDTAAGAVLVKADPVQ